MNDKNLDINRREFLRRLGLGTASAFSLMALGPLEGFAKMINDKVKEEQSIR